MYSLSVYSAPTHVFLPEVAKALGAECVLPEHAEVANAIGALMADIHAVIRVEISQRLSPKGGLEYIVHAPTGSLEFTDFEEASKAAQRAEEAATAEARAARITCGLVHKVHRVTALGLPLKAYEDLKAFKLFLISAQVDNTKTVT